MIKLHDNSWIDAHDIDSIKPIRGRMECCYTEIQMKSGNKITLHTQDQPRSWSDREDRMSMAIREAEELATRVMKINNQPNQ